MTIIDHLGITITDLPAAVARFDPILGALGFARSDADGSASWFREGEPELILYPARDGDGDDDPHHHGRVGWQHLALEVGSRAEVERLHGIALDAGWSAVREPKVYPRFSERYYASFVEDADGIRLEFMHHPPAEAAAG